jgi:hypothetical protein
MKWSIIWQTDPDNLLSCVERDWFREIVSQVPIDAVHVDYQNEPLLKTVIPYSIICASCPNQVGSRELAAYLSRFPEPRVLYHMKDGRGQIKDLVSIRQRPAAVEDRAVPGHWEGDLCPGRRTAMSRPWSNVIPVT